MALGRKGMVEGTTSASQQNFFQLGLVPKPWTFVTAICLHPTALFPVFNHLSLSFFWV